jgi:hypothetical protein
LHKPKTLTTGACRLLKVLPLEGWFIKGIQIVEHPNVMTNLQQALGNVGTDKPCAAGDEKLHAERSVLCR